MNNPYSWNEVKPEICYGRDALLNEVLNGLPGNPRLSFGIAGGRRMGKSTLLRRVDLELKASVEQWRTGGLLVLPIYIDGLALPRPLTPTTLWGGVLKEVQKKLDVENTQLLETTDPFGAFKDLVQPVLMHHPERPRVAVIFDEVEPILIYEWSDGFLSNWRALLSNTPDLSEYFTAIFAGAREMAALQTDIGSPLKDVLEWRNLRSFDYEDACQLMQSPISIEWPEVFMKRIYRETGGHPMLLQYIMQVICSRPLEEAEQSLHSAINKFFKERRWQFDEWWGDRYCSVIGRRIYKRLPDDGSPLLLRDLVREFGSDQANDALEILQHLGLAVAEDDGFSFRFAGEMFRRWYRQYAILEEAPQHDLEIYTRLLEQIGTEAANKYLSAWRIHQSDLPNYSGALVEIRGVLEFIVDKFAPSEVVQSESGFKLETDRREPTLRQRIRYYARRLYDNERAKEIVGDYNLLETVEQISQTATRIHRVTSTFAHETATRDRAYQALKQWDGILAQLLPA